MSQILLNKYESLRKVIEKSHFLIITNIIIIVLAPCTGSCKKPAIEFQDLPPVKIYYNEVLGRPTGNSVTMNILFDQPADIYCEYGTSENSCSMSTSAFKAEKDVPLVMDFTGLTPDTKYFYRVRYREEKSDSPFLAGEVHSFHTARSPGSTFTFAIEADPHLDNNSDTSAYALTLKNILSGDPDFMLDLGDSFFSEKQPSVNQEVITARHLLYRPFFGLTCHSVPLYLVIGNHEGESGWFQNGSGNSIPVMAVNTRKKYYPNPETGSFYSGNTKNEDFVGNRESYYAWQWGDALFIVLDPYWYTTRRGVSNWDWTLGADQYNWFKNVITSSQAKYKFVFSHQLVGGYTKDARGGAEYAGFYEMGGNNIDSTYGFDANRPGWGKPIHTLMKENNATIFFHGHDHFFGKQEKDGVIYQEVPQPSNKSLTNISAQQYGYVDGVFLPGRGYLRVTVTNSNVKVEYIGTYLPTEENGTHKNGDVIYSYTIN